jgi:hypothetical protein
MTDSLKTLLAEIVDYAGLFPPSKLPLDVAVKNYATYVKGEDSWMLGRFVLPIESLDEFSELASPHFSKKNPWRLSVLVDSELEIALAKISEFNTANDGKAVIDTLEIKVSDAAEISGANEIVPKQMRVFFEFPLTDILTDFITTLTIAKRGAKIRTGGITQDAFPATDLIIKFMRICVAANIPFKATAGLHHPLRCTKPLTYAEDAPKGLMHGFLNVFLSACYLRKNLNSNFVHQLMNEADSGNFAFSEEGIMWNGHLLSNVEIATMRAKNAISFGSCSFLEPIEDLQSLEIF